MKTLSLGIGLLCLSFLADAGTTVPGGKTSILVLKGRVPASTSLVWEKDDKSSVPVIKTNGSKFRPQVVLKDQKNHRQITVIQP